MKVGDFATFRPQAKKSKLIVAYCLVISVNNFYL